MLRINMAYVMETTRDTGQELGIRGLSRIYIVAELDIYESLETT